MERILLPATFKDISGQRFGRLAALYPVEIRKNRHVVYACRCDCGESRRVTNSNLNSGHTQSCGCYAVERTSEANGKHYRARTSVYRRWSQMIQRCHLKTAPNYQFYGARGLTVCDRWRFGDDEQCAFDCFLKDMGEPPPGSWLERKDNAKGYSRDNCCWASKHDQFRNTRRNVQVEWCGKTQIVTDWERELGKKPDAIAKRLRRGWSVERALST